ncbi:MAG: hypothetical protein II719_03960 [Clostridia bacterium]|nr:hypothetical protein [Clostridia bacterium]
MEENRISNEELNCTEETERRDPNETATGETADLNEQDIPDVLSNGELSVQLPFRKVADVSEIIRGWQREWNEGYPHEQKSAEPWRFHSPAFLPGNRLALVFERDDEVYEGRGAVAHVLNHFRVLTVDLGSMEIVQQFAFHCQDTDVLTVLSTPDRKGIQAVVKVSGRENGVWSVLPMVPTNDDGQYKIAPYAEQVLQFPNGGIVASYSHNDLDSAKIPVAFWSPEDGSYAGGLKDPDELECAALTLDHSGCVWAHLMPSGKIVRMGEEARTFESAYHGFSAFGVSSDCRLMAVSWQRGPCENRMHLMYRKGSRYLAFGKLEFGHLPGRENPLDCVTFGFPAFYGSRFVFNKDGTLYLFDLDSAAEMWR